jgi:16S rRNA (uracil1498-N3)-methyltransferase
VNLILFEAAELGRPLPLSDVRAQHVLSVLKLGPGDIFDAGIVDGPRGKATLVSLDSGVLVLSFAWQEEPRALLPVTLVLGLPRPQTARKVLGEATALGVEAMHFVGSERGERSYLQSKLWTTDEWRRHLIDGAQQAFSTRLPRVTYGARLSQTVATLAPGACLIALDNYESRLALTDVSLASPVVLAVGSERGWSDGERQLLGEAGFEFVHLGERVLRVETACVAAVAIVLSRLNLL